MQARQWCPYYRLPLLAPALRPLSPPSLASQFATPLKPPSLSVVLISLLDGSAGLDVPAASTVSGILARHGGLHRLADGQSRARVLAEAGFAVIEPLPAGKGGGGSPRP